MGRMKVCFLGSPRVGKSCICYRLCVADDFLKHYDQTLEDCYADVEVGGDLTLDGRTYSLEVSDTGGEFGFNGLFKDWGRDELIVEGWVTESDMFIIVYDVTREHTFVDAVKYEKLIKNTKKNAPIVWLGSKSDLLSCGQRTMLEEKGPFEYFAFEKKRKEKKVDSDSQGNTVDKVNFFEKSGEMREISSLDKDRKHYVVSGKFDDKRKFNGIVHELVRSAKNRRDWEDKRNLFEKQQEASPADKVHSTKKPFEIKVTKIFG